MRIKITKSYCRNCMQAGDVKISINKNGHNSRNCVVAFYNNNHRKVTTSDFIIPSIDDELGRLYFEIGDSDEGFKLTMTKGNTDIRRFSFTIRDNDLWAERAGTYNLLYDSSEKLYYLDFRNKIKNR